MTLQEIQTTTEHQIFDRKSARIDAKSLAITMIAMANADGGCIALGVENDGTITGVNDYQNHVNDLLRVPFDYCVPSLNVVPEYVIATNTDGNQDHIILLHVAQSQQLHANQADEVFYRVGDKSKKLNFEQRMQLFFAKGGGYYEDTPVNNTSFDDIDFQTVKDYTDIIGYNKSPESFLCENGYIVKTAEKDTMTAAAILLFGKRPDLFFPMAQLRFVRFEGNEQLTGSRMNVIKDVTFAGRILETTNKAIAYVSTQIKEHSYLGRDAHFVTIPELPEFCWTELIVNAVCHRDYSIKGTDIQIKMFDDHYTVESPGVLPGTVRTSNIRTTHFLRNPKIAHYLKAYHLVKEFGEGVDRIYQEMNIAGLPAPHYMQQDFILVASLDKDIQYVKKQQLSQKLSEESFGKEHETDSDTTQKELTTTQKELTTTQKELTTTQKQILEYISKHSSATRKEIAENIKNITADGVKYHLSILQKNGVLHREGGRKEGRWIIGK